MGRIGPISRFDGRKMPEPQAGPEVSPYRLRCLANAARVAGLT
jgi:hypothetical protein